MSSLLRRFRLAPCSVGFIVLIALLHSQSSMAAGSAPNIAENAYCGKGDAAKFGEKDGPAQLPQSCYYTAIDGTPSPGKQIRVSAKSDLHEAVDSAKCGDTLLLAAGASYEIKELPAKKCDPTLHHHSHRHARRKIASRRNTHLSRLGWNRQSPRQAGLCATLRRSSQTDAHANRQESLWRYARRSLPLYRYRVDHRARY